MHDEEKTDSRFNVMVHRNGQVVKYLVLRLHIWSEIQPYL